MASEDPPPAYTAEAVPASAAEPTATSYILSRPFTETAPADVVEYKITLLAGSETPSFPEPEKTWLGRDVNHRDWHAFTSQLGPPPPEGASTESKDEYGAKATAVIKEWNDGFFKPRGLHVEPVLNSANGSKGFGFKVGNSFVGLSVGEDAHGYGLKLPGMLFGVAEGKGKKTEEK